MWDGEGVGGDVCEMRREVIMGKRERNWKRDESQERGRGGGEKGDSPVDCACYGDVEGESQGS